MIASRANARPIRGRWRRRIWGLPSTPESAALEKVLARAHAEDPALFLLQLALSDPGLRAHPTGR